VTGPRKSGFRNGLSVRSAKSCGSVRRAWRREAVEYDGRAVRPTPGASWGTRTADFIIAR
jgi:hypothetical protein